MDQFNSTNPWVSLEIATRFGSVKVKEIEWYTEPNHYLMLKIRCEASSTEEYTRLMHIIRFCKYHENVRLYAKTYPYDNIVNYDRQDKGDDTCFMEFSYNDFDTATGLITLFGRDLSPDPYIGKTNEQFYVARQMLANYHAKGGSWSEPIEYKWLL